MSFYRTYECSSCLKCFDFLHQKLSSVESTPPPDYCPLCGVQIGVKQTRKKRSYTAKPGVRASGADRTYARNQIQSENNVYRAMETSSEVRMEQAADMLHVNKSDMTHMKMTNMRDNVKAGELSVVTSAPTDATKIIGAPVGNMVFQGPQAAEYGKSVGSGPEPFAGNRAREMISSGHEGRARQVEASGRLNKK